jgi:hypothetical protein
MPDLDPREWRAAVAAYLASKEFVAVFLGDIARDVLNRAYSDMSPADWRRLAWVMTGLGWRCRGMSGAKMWEPAPARGTVPAAWTARMRAVPEKEAA